MNVPTKVPATYIEAWDSAVATHPHAPFLLFHSDEKVWTQWSYSEFDKHVERVTACLVNLGVQRDHSVHLCLRNSPAFIAVQLACARLRAWTVPVDPASSPRDIARQISRTAPTVGIAAEARSETYRAGAAGQLNQILLLHEDERDFTEISAFYPKKGHDLSATTPARPEDRLAVMFTSGTTSEPKGVVLTQANYATLTRSMAELANLGPQHRWFISLPMFHANAQFYCLAPAIGAGASVALSSKFSASGWLQQAREAKATHASLFAAPIRMILNRTAKDSEPLHLTHVWFAQNLNHSQYTAFTKLAGTQPRQLYGMTETVTIVTRDNNSNPSHDTIGRAVPGRKILLVDPSTLDPVSSGEPGLLLLGGKRGHDIFQEYLNRPEANKSAFVSVNGQEWFVTGDLVRTSRDGTLTFVGRIDDVTKIAGENVSLTELEARISEAPEVAEVAVVAVDDPIRDHAAVAYVVPEKFVADHVTAESLTRWAEKHLAPACRPKEWHLIDELPRTSVGKIRKFKLAR